jgi:hypothetical protein
MKKVVIGILIIFIIFYFLVIQNIFIQFPPGKGLIGGTTRYQNISGNVFGCAALPPEYVPKECDKIICIARICYLKK